MGNKNRSPVQDTDDEPEFKRRQVLSGIGGMVATGAIVAPTDDEAGSGGLADRLAEQFQGVTTAADREELAYLLDELRTDAVVLDAHDLADLPAARRREFAEKGRRFKNLMGGECGFEGYEVHGGPYNGCCAAHDSCEGSNGEPDHVFNGDDCDDGFWGCAATITTILML